VLEAIVDLFIEVGEDKRLSFYEVSDTVEALCKKRVVIDVIR
jgi:hypothetical protein